ncbi:MAG TPA: DUF1223 domain-containing protein [Kofleriaceae bacterium]|nr:DUF1223 domain-containing protein [Kofleriaceae bacterium]
MVPLLLGACATSEADPAPASTTKTGPVVLELFTSQGCSSCPPADRLLAKLGQDTELAPLAFHVDYWNGLGWADPYSTPAWTERQHQYARALGDTRVYTPELVVGGAVGMLGSDAAQARRAIASLPRPALLPATAIWSKDKVEITATAPANADVVVAIWEAERTVKVPRGENAGATLTNTRIVRKLERVATAGHRGTVTIALDPAWKATGAVAFAQGADRRIVASALLPR